MKLPRNVSGAHLAGVLCRRWQYKKVHQTGSHIIIETSEPVHHRIAIPDHHPLRLGTFNAILRARSPYPRTRLTSATIAGTTSNKSPTIP